MKTTHQRFIARLGICVTALLPVASQAADQVWRYSYNANGQLVEAEGPREDLVDRESHSYDSAGNRTSTSNALGQVTYFYDHNERGQPGRIVDANGTVTTLTYDPRGRITASTVHSPDGDSSAAATTYFDYDGEGLLIATRGPEGTTLSYEYDAARRLVAVVNGSGERLQYSLDPAGNRLMEQLYTADGELANELTRQFDELGRVLSERGTQPSAVAHGYDRNGDRLSTTDGNGYARLQTFDDLRRISGLQAAHGFQVDLEHDQRDNTVAVTDPAALSTRNDYDGHDNLIARASPDTGLSSFGYDSAGNRIEDIDARGVSVSRQYDALGRTVAERFEDSSLDILYRYDEGSNASGRLTGVTDAAGDTTLAYDHRGNLVRREWDTGARRIDVQFRYDRADRLVGITYPSGRQVIYERDTGGRIRRVSTVGADGISRLIADQVSYRPFGPMAGHVFGNGVSRTAAHDLGYRLTTLRHGQVLDLAYGYDGAGNIVGITDGLDPGRSQVLAYDGLDRLAAATGAYGALDYRYDASGNRLAVNRNGELESYTYDTASHRLLSTVGREYDYDGAGNVVSRLDGDGHGLLFIYDARNRLAEVRQLDPAGERQLARYVFNAAGQRALKQTGDQLLHFVYDEQGRLLAEVDATSTSLREYIYLGEQAIAMAYTHRTQAPAVQGAETVFDDDDAATTRTGDWERVRKKAAWGDYYHRSQNTGASFRWNTGPLKQSRYEVYAWWPRSRKNNPEARYVIAHDGGVSEVTVSQTRDGKQWVKLGTFSFEGSGNEYIELSDTGGLTAADGIRLVELEEPPAIVTTALYYLHNDHLGTPQAATDQARNVVWRASYRPFGQADIQVADIEQNLRFPGQYFDSETGLHYNYFRDYDPSLGRYLQSDPIGLAGGVNSYNYVNANPLKFSDFFGLAPGQGGKGRSRSAPSGPPSNTQTVNLQLGSTVFTWDQSGEFSTSQTTAVGISTFVEICPPATSPGCGAPGNQGAIPDSITAGWRGLGITRKAGGKVCISIGPTIGLPGGANYNVD